MAPTIGSIVHVLGVEPTMNNGSDIAPAIITCVCTADQVPARVNLRVLCDGPSVLWETSVDLYGDEKAARNTRAEQEAAGWSPRIAAFWPPRAA